MNKKVYSIVLIVMLVLFSISIFGAIPTQEREALISLYNATNGDNWTNNNGWKGNNNEPDGFSQIGTEDTWQGITVSGDHVTRIELISNNLTGGITTDLENLSNLEFLDLKNNQLSGSIPQELGNLENLEHLDLDYNQLSGTIPPELGNLKNLQYFSMYSNQLSGSIPPELGNLSNLKTLRLWNNQLSGSIPPELGNLNNLEDLQLHWTFLSGAIPPELGNLKNLLALRLGGFNPGWENSNRLLNPRLSQNQLSGSIPQELFNLSKLKVLLIYNTQISDEIPPELCNLSDLIYLRLGQSQLSGSIPPELGNLKSLLRLDLYNNQLSGDIPKELRNLSNLEHVLLYGNQLIGSIPKELGSLTHLVYLLLYNNQLSGNIPQELGNLSKLKILGLQGNQLSGSIPTSLANLTNLESVSEDIFYTNFGYNGLYTNDDTLRVFLNSKDSDWEDTQTIAPSDVSARALSSSSIRVSWTPITYTGNSGGYKVYYSTTSEGPWSYSGLTADKSASFYDATGLSPATTYYFIVKTQTNPHSNNLNTIVSEPSEETSATTDQGVLTYTIELNRTRLDFASEVGANVLKSQRLMITGIGGIINWTATSDASWLELDISSGTGSAVVTVTVNPSWLIAGTYTGTITVSDPGAVNSPQTVSVILKIYNAGSTKEPFGTFETPIDGSTVRGSIPVTGWALDDIGVESVKIYRGNAGDLTYIGDAVFAEGARPDVEQAHPGYPMNYKAGWGYIMLTNFLLDGGNGTFKIHAIATDVEGHQITLGTKTIICDNANAVKPFGAIDMPTQGGEASGSSFRNSGWVLTPPPNSIPTDGSSINVFVDGVNLGHPTYNVYRSDIAAFFPGYANSDGAHAYFDFDTTTYENGIHSIYWTAEDSAGNADGIGSRYFTIQNTGNSNSKISAARHQEYARDKVPYTFSQIAAIPVNDLKPIKVKKSFKINSGYYTTDPDEEGTFNIKIKELERIVIELSNESSVIGGYSIIGNELRSLPIGSTLDTRKGIFYWQPGPGFFGEYRFVFVEEMQSGEMKRKNVTVTIEPKATHIVKMER